MPTAFALAKWCIQDRNAHIGVVGLRPAGLQLSRPFSESEFVVQGFELSPPSIERAYPRQTQLTEQISRDRGRFHTTSDYRSWSTPKS